MGMSRVSIQLFALVQVVVSHSRIPGSLISFSRSARSVAAQRICVGAPVSSAQPGSSAGAAAAGGGFGSVGRPAACRL